MYLTIEETAEYTNLSEDYIKSLVLKEKSEPFMTESNF